MKRARWAGLGMAFALGVGLLSGCGKGGGPTTPVVPEDGSVPPAPSGEACMQAVVEGGAWSAVYGATGLPDNLGFVSIRRVGNRRLMGLMLQGIVPGSAGSPQGSGIFLWCVAEESARSFDLAEPIELSGEVLGAAAEILVAHPESAREFRTDAKRRGRLVLTELDLERKRARGTFQFDAVEFGSGEVRRVAEGSFSGPIDVIVDSGAGS